MTDRKRLLVLGVSIVVLVFGGAAWAGNNALEITEAFLVFDEDPNLIFIYGLNIDMGDDPIVMLGDYPAPLVVTEYSEHEIIAELPVDLAAGDYLLTVDTGNGPHQFDSHDLTIGAVGPRGEQGLQGDQGEQGIKGDQGEQGIKGDQGEQGIKGDQGEQGIKGVKGDQGEQGIKGDKGDEGDTGPQGVKGDKGDQGYQGIQGEPGPPGADGGASDFEQVFVSFTCPAETITLDGFTSPLGNSCLFDAVCPAGKQAIGGGWTLTHSTGTPHLNHWFPTSWIRASYPRYTLAGWAWTVYVFNGTIEDAGGEGGVWAWCATVTP